MLQLDLLVAYFIDYLCCIHPLPSLSMVVILRLNIPLCVCVCRHVCGCMCEQSTNHISLIKQV